MAGLAQLVGWVTWLCSGLGLKESGREELTMGSAGEWGCREVRVVREAKDSVRQGSLAWRWGQRPEVRVAVEGSHD